MTEAAIYERISGIRAELLEVIGKVGSSNRSLELDATVIEDDLIMVANRLGRVAGQLQPAALVARNASRRPRRSPPSGTGLRLTRETSAFGVEG